MATAETSTPTPPAEGAPVKDEARMAAEARARARAAEAKREAAAAAKDEKDDAPEDGAKDEAAAKVKVKEPEVNKLFRMVMKHEASDLHLKVGQPPMMRMRGDIRRSNGP